MEATNHVLLTRFNLPSPGVQSLIRAKEGWLRERVDLFETYCLPSVLAQTCSDFTWIIYLDPESPRWLRDRMAKHSETGAFSPVYRESVSEEELIDDIRKIAGPVKRYVMTTNLDNDDAISSDFISRLREVAPRSAAVAIYVKDGLIRSGEALYLHRYPRNAFNSVCTDWSEAKTCWSEWHTDFGAVMPVIELGGPPGWMQVVHGSNVSNRVRGSRISPDALRPSFGDLLDGVSAPRRGETIRDTLIARPTRFVRESGRAMAKRGVVAVLGKGGIDRVQVALRSLARREQSPRIARHDAANDPGIARLQTGDPRDHDL